MTLDLVSVILPVRNGAEFLADAVGSVMQQGYRPIEIIIVDDGSTDATASIATSISREVRYFHQPHSGPAAARNLGVREARGDFIAFIDADDLWPPDKLRLQMRCFEVFPSVDIVQGLIRRIRLPSLGRAQSGGADIDIPFIYTNLGSMIMRRSVFDTIGYFEESLHFHEDTDFWLRAREQGLRIVVQPTLALVYRIHGHNLTTGEDIRTTGFLNIVRRSIDRRRRNSHLSRELGRLQFVSDLPEQDQRVDRQATLGSESRPLVSVILYAGDNLASVDRAIASIRSQNYEPLELWIVGPRSREVQASLLTEFHRVEIIEGYADLAPGLNAAIVRSRGEIVAFLDAECEWAFQKLKTQVAYLLSHPTAGYAVGMTRHIIFPGTKYPSELLDGLSLRKSLGDLLGTLVVRRSTLDEVGGFQVGLPGLEETDWILRAQDEGLPKIVLPGALCFRHVQREAHTIQADRMKAALLESVRASVLRKRNANLASGKSFAGRMR